MSSMPSGVSSSRWRARSTRRVASRRCGVVPVSATKRRAKDTAPLVTPAEPSAPDIGGSPLADGLCSRRTDLPERQLAG